VNENQIFCLFVVLECVVVINEWVVKIYQSYLSKESKAVDHIRSVKSTTKWDQSNHIRRAKLQ